MRFPGDYVHRDRGFYFRAGLQERDAAVGEEDDAPTVLIAAGFEDGDFASGGWYDNVTPATTTAEAAVAVCGYQAPRLNTITGTVFNMMRTSSVTDRRVMYSRSKASFRRTSSTDSS